MKYSLIIDNVSSIEWGLSIQEAYLFSWIYTLPSWADKTSINDRDYYFSSRNKVIEELPILTDKPDTVYRYFRKLEEKGLIILQKFDNKDYVALTQKAKKWNNHEGGKSENNPSVGNKSGGRKIIRASENNPAELGKKSENNSEKNPTYNITSYNNITTITKKEEVVVEIVDLDNDFDSEIDHNDSSDTDIPAFVQAERDQLIQAIGDKPTIEEFKEFGREMWKSKTFMATVCMSNKFNPEDFKHYLAIFIAEKSEEGKFSKSLGDAKSHFMNWVRKRYEGDQSRPSTPVTHTPVDPKYRMQKI